MTGDLEQAADWAHRHRTAMFVGEFGAHHNGAIAERAAAWTSWVRQESERLGMGWCYWAYTSEFAACDTGESRWYAPIVNALG